MASVEFKMGDKELAAQVLFATRMLKRYKPEDRSEKARAFAVTITELEKAYAFFKTFVVDVEEPDATSNLA